MREIKFRAWDEENRTMLEPQDLTMDFSYWKWLGHKDVPLMQFTGLTDKNGKEIYEGDLLKWESGLVQTVSWDNRGYWHPISTTAPVFLEIIGNIYENPDLLK